MRASFSVTFSRVCDSDTRVILWLLGCVRGKVTIILFTTKCQVHYKMSPPRVNINFIRACGEKYLAFQLCFPEKFHRLLRARAFCEQSIFFVENILLTNAYSTNDVFKVRSRL